MKKNSRQQQTKQQQSNGWKPGNQASASPTARP